MKNENETNEVENVETENNVALNVEEILNSTTLRVYEFANSDESFGKTYSIIDSEDFKEMDLCGCYASYGQNVSCEDAACYARSNSYLDISKETITIDGVEYEINHAIKLVKSEDVYLSDDDYEEFCEEHKDLLNDEEDCHTEVTALNFWNGHNWQTLVLKTDQGEPDLNELDDDNLQAKILFEYENKEFANKGAGYENYKSENYGFTVSFFSDAAFEVASVTSN